MLTPGKTDHRRSEASTSRLARAPEPKESTESTIQGIGANIRTGCGLFPGPEEPPSRTWREVRLGGHQRLGLLPSASTVRLLQANLQAPRIPRWCCRHR